MKIERIIVSFDKKKIIHTTSSERKYIDMNSKREELGLELLDYVENYITENGFELFDQDNGVSFTIIKK